MWATRTSGMRATWGSEQVRGWDRWVKTLRSRLSTAGWIVGVSAHLIALVPRSAAQDLKPATEERVKHATVFITVAASGETRGDRVLGGGTGYFINATGLLLTNNHVVDPTHRFIFDRQRQAWYFEIGTLTYTAVVDSGTSSEQSYECTVLFQDRTADQALLQVKGKDGKLLSTPNYLRLLREEAVTPNLLAWAFGFPGGDRQSRSRDRHAAPTVTRGRVLEIPRTPSGRVRKIFTDVVVNRGNSGGPLVDINGFVIGTVTLKDKPKEREDTGGANHSALSPTKISREMLQSAFHLKKMPDGTDYSPFMELLPNDEGRIDIPEFRRQRDKDVLFYPSGDKIHGVVSTSKILWNSPIGSVEVPTEAIAYMMKADSGASLILEGGNRIASLQSDQKIRFRTGGGGETEYGLDTVGVVGFKTAGRKITPIDGKVYVFDSDLSHLVLSEVSGTATFSGAAGAHQIAFEDIARVERSPEGLEQVLFLADGQRMTGKFQETPYKAKIAATGTPIAFNLSQVTQASVNSVHLRGNTVAGLDLVQIMAVAQADPGMRKIARLIESGDFKKARLYLNEAQGAEVADFSKDEKERFSLLDGVCSIGEGQYEQAKKALKIAAKADQENIAAFATACQNVLKTYPSMEYKGKPLSDRATFIAAGTEMADGLVRKVRDALRDVRRLEYQKKGDYATAMNLVRKYETELPGAAVFAGADADDQMLRLWKLALLASEKEIVRLEGFVEDKQQESNTATGRRQAARSSQKDIEDARKDRDEAIEAFGQYFGKRWEYGFRIENPDVLAMKEEKQRRSRGGVGEDEGP